MSLCSIGVKLTSDVGVKSNDISRRFDSEGMIRCRSDTEELKPGEQTGLETPVVLALNYAGSTFCGFEHIYCARQPGGFKANA